MVCAYEEKKNVNKYAVRSDLATHKFILILKHAMFDCYRIYAKKTQIWSSAIESILKHLCRFIQYQNSIGDDYTNDTIRSSMIKFLQEIC